MSDYDFDLYHPEPEIDPKARKRQAKRLRVKEGLPDTECLVDAGYDPDDCDCDVCMR